MPHTEDALEVVPSIVVSDESKRNYPVLQAAVRELGARMLIWGLDSGEPRYEFYWQTEISRDEVIRAIRIGGQVLKATSYGWAYAHSMSWTRHTSDDPNFEEDDEGREALLETATRSSLQFSGLATRHGNKYVSWTAAFNDTDFAHDQIHVSVHGRELTLTEDWLAKLVGETTSSPMLRQYAQHVLRQFQEIYDAEAVLSVLKSDRVPCPKI